MESSLGSSMLSWFKKSDLSAEFDSFLWTVDGWLTDYELSFGLWWECAKKSELSLISDLLLSLACCEAASIGSSLTD
jgi:hypothetical protein